MVLESTGVVVEFRDGVHGYRIRGGCRCGEGVDGRGCPLTRRCASASPPGRGGGIRSSCGAPPLFVIATPLSSLRGTKQPGGGVGMRPSINSGRTVLCGRGQRTPKSARGELVEPRQGMRPSINSGRTVLCGRGQRTPKSARGELVEPRQGMRPSINSGRTVLCGRGQRTPKSARGEPRVYPERSRREPRQGRWGCARSRPSINSGRTVLCGRGRPGAGPA